MTPSRECSWSHKDFKLQCKHFPVYFKNTTRIEKYHDISFSEMLPLNIIQNRETARKGNNSLSLHIVSECWKSIFHMGLWKGFSYFLLLKHLHELEKRIIFSFKRNACKRNERMNGWKNRQYGVFSLNMLTYPFSSQRIKVVSFCAIMYLL